MDLSNLSQEDIDSIKNQLSQIEPGTEGTVRVGYGDSEFRVYMPEEINYDTGIQIAGRGGGGIGDCNEVFNHVVDNQSNTIIIIYPTTNEYSEENYEEYETIGNSIESIKNNVRLN